MIDGDVVFDPQNISIGAHVVIDEGATIGQGTTIHSGVFIDREVRIGEGCTLHVNAVIKQHCVLGNRVILHSGAIIGSDGFGYEVVNGRHVKIDQLGIVQIDDDVEVGSCTTIDRARFGRTWIGEGSKIDNLVQIGHNTILGKHCIIIAQTGISGSCRLGSHVTHGCPGRHRRASRDYRPGGGAREVWCHQKSHAARNVHRLSRPLMEGRKMLSLPAKIPDLIKRVRELEKKLAALEAVSNQA